MGQFYEEFYKITPENEMRLRELLLHPSHGAEARADIERRCGELKKIQPDRCHASRDQLAFLEKVLSGESHAS